MTTNPSLSHRLQLLSEEFGATLTQYQDTYQNYMAILKSKQMSESAAMDASANQTALTGAAIAGKIDMYAVIPNSAYWGQTGLSEGTAHSATECLADCYTKPACSGATFDSNTNYCWTRAGEGKIAPTGQTNQTAIIKKTLLYSTQLQELRDKLNDINAKIMALIEENSAEFDKDQHLQMQRAEVLKKTRQSMAEQDAALKLLNRQGDTLASASENSALIVNSNYGRYLIYLFLAIVTAIFLMKILAIPNAAAAAGGLRGGSSGAAVGANIIGMGLSFVTNTIENIGDIIA